jgi:hypothetical protein
MGHPILTIQEVPMTAPRGREARLREQFAQLYVGIQPGVWVPVEKLLRQVTDLVHHDRSKSGIITGHRLLREEHFDFRGASARPKGLPQGSTRLSDSGVEPVQSGRSDDDQVHGRDQHE